MSTALLTIKGNVLHINGEVYGAKPQKIIARDVTPAIVAGVSDANEFAAHVAANKTMDGDKRRKLLSGIGWMTGRLWRGEEPADLFSKMGKRIGRMMALIEAGPASMIRTLADDATVPQAIRDKARIKLAAMPAAAAQKPPAVNAPAIQRPSPAPVAAPKPAPTGCRGVFRPDVYSACVKKARAELGTTASTIDVAKLAGELLVKM